jgi:hypothetical protein
MKDEIRFERLAGAKNAYGELEPDWIALGDPIRAEVLFGAGQERREAAQQQGSAPATFRVRTSPLTCGVTLKEDRMKVRTKHRHDNGYGDVYTKNPGKIYELPDAVASSLIDAGYVEADDGASGQSDGGLEGSVENSERVVKRRRARRREAGA